MARTTNTVPYTNARRAGRTQPGLIEFIDGDDPRRRGPRYVENRADRRRRGHRLPIMASKEIALPIATRNPIPRSVRRANARRGL